MLQHNSTDRDKEFENLLAVAKLKQLPEKEQAQLLDQIRSGDREPIKRLVESFVPMILLIARQFQTEIAIEELVAAGRMELLQQAERELNSTSRERFFRFGSWCVRQAILQKIKKVLR